MIHRRKSLNFAETKKQWEIYIICIGYVYLKNSVISIASRCFHIGKNWSYLFNSFETFSNGFHVRLIVDHSMLDIHSHMLEVQANCCWCYVKHTRLLALVIHNQWHNTCNWNNLVRWKKWYPVTSVCVYMVCAGKYLLYIQKTYIHMSRHL